MVSRQWQTLVDGARHLAWTVKPSDSARGNGTGQSLHLGRNRPVTCSAGVGETPHNHLLTRGKKMGKKIQCKPPPSSLPPGAVDTTETKTDDRWRMRQNLNAITADVPLNSATLTSAWREPSTAICAGSRWEFGSGSVHCPCPATWSLENPCVYPSGQDAGNQQEPSLWKWLIINYFPFFSFF